MTIIRYIIITALIGLSTENEENNVIRFEEVDKNEDNTVSFNEIQQWNKANGQLDDRKLKDNFHTHDENGDGTLTIAEFVPLALVLTRRPIKQSEQLFKKVDLNKDGAVTRDEALRSQETGISKEIIDGIFEVADYNHDGKITQNEFSSVFDADPSIDRPKTQEEQDRETAQRLFALIDQNGDHRLSPQEVHQFANSNSDDVTEQDVLQSFQHLDVNRDGYLDLPELYALPKKMVELVHFKEPPPVIH